MMSAPRLLTLKFEDGLCMNDPTVAAPISTPTISAIICAYTLDRLADVVDAVRSMEMQRPPPDQIIVVVDHNSSLLAALRSRISERIILIENAFERGLSGARNSGIVRAAGSLVFFLDDDAVADPDCLRVLSERCLERGVIGAGARIEPRFAEACPSWFPPEFLWVVGCTYLGLKPGPTRNLLGAAMCIRRDAFDKAGGFDSRLGRTNKKLPFGCEETEFCIRAAKEMGGAAFVYEPGARVVHKVPATRLSRLYFIKRCYAEGLSKARLSSVVGSKRSLANERSYVARTLTRSFARNFGDLFLRRDFSGVGRVAAVILGLACAAGGFLRGSLQPRVAENLEPPRNLGWAP